MTNVSTYAGRRAQLPSRRAHWLYRFECDGQTYTGGIGRFLDGRIAEVFINGAKVGTAAETSAQDADIGLACPAARMPGGNATARPGARGRRWPPFGDPFQYRTGAGPMNDSLSSDRIDVAPLRKRPRVR
jgi:hypothetical protein